MIVIRELSEIVNFYDLDAEVLAASIRGPRHITESALAGAHIATLPFKVLQQMVHHPLTDMGIVALQGRLGGRPARRHAPCKRADVLGVRRVGSRAGLVAVGRRCDAVARRSRRRRDASTASVGTEGLRSRDVERGRAFQIVDAAAGPDMLRASPPVARDGTPIPREPRPVARPIVPRRAPPVSNSTP